MVFKKSKWQFLSDLIISPLRGAKPFIEQTWIPITECFFLMEPGKK